MTPDSPRHDAIERDLFRRLADQRLTPQEFAEVDRRLLDDSAFRARYVRFMDLESSLYDELSRGPEESFLELGPTSAGARPAAKQDDRTFAWSARFVGWTAIACSLAALFAGVLIGNRLARTSNTPVAEFPLQPAATGVGMSAARTSYAEIPLKGMEPVAVVTHAEGLGADLTPGTRLKPGSLTLTKGQVQMEFFGGAKLLVEGPCELHVLSPKSATLVSGRAAARVLESGRGFTLNTPEAVMVDLGTEFAVDVNEQQGSEVHVVDGEVEVSLLGEDGSTLTSHRIVESDGLRIRPGDKTLNPDDAPQLPPLKILDIAPRPLATPETYVRAVLDAKPLIYWRFESTEGGRVPNAAGPDYSGRLTLDEKKPSSLKVVDGRIEFSASEGPRFVAPTEPLSTLNAKSFSCEFWVNPALLHYGTLAAIVPEGDVKSNTHLNVVELAYQSSLVHEPGAFRFLHRHPPAANGGINLFTPTGCTPGRWHHVVAVKTPEEIKLYLDGRPVRQISGDMSGDEAAYRLHLGELRTTINSRQFIGSLDEFALYMYDLSDAEIERHFRLIGADDAH